MSPSWRDQIQVFFAPRRIDLVRWSRGFKPIQTSRVNRLCEEHVPDQPLWDAPLQQLEQLLKDANATEMSVTLSNHFVRYLTLPPQEEITTPDEVLAYATFRMREIYAERMNDWELSISAWNPSSGAVCAAITRDLLRQLQELANRYNVKLKHIEPYLSSTFDQWHQSFGNERTCYALVETGRVCIALLADGVWHSIRNQKILHSLEDELLAALDQEIIFSGHKSDVEEVRVFAPEHPDLVLPRDCGWKIIPPSIELVVPAHYPTVINLSDEANSCVA